MKETLFKLRVSQKMSVSELALVLDIAEDRVRGFENGSVEPTIEELKKISIFYNVSVDELVGLTQLRDVENTKIGAGREEKQVAKEKVKAAKGEKRPFCSRWLYIAVPIVIVVLLGVMAGVAYEWYDETMYDAYYYSFTMYDCFFAISSKYVAIGILMFLSMIPVAIYMIVDMCLPKRFRAKLNLTSAIFFGVVGLLNLCLAISTIILFGVEVLAACGIVVYIFWFVISAYLIALSIWDIVHMCINAKVRN